MHNTLEAREQQQMDLSYMLGSSSGSIPSWESKLILSRFGERGSWVLRFCSPGIETTLPTILPSSQIELKLSVSANTLK